MKIIDFIIIGLCIITNVPLASAQTYTIKKQPYADQKMYHFGFMVGIHTQDMIISHTGYLDPVTNEAWFSEIPSYSVGLSVGIIADRYINEYLNIRAVPTLHFGEKKFVFREQTTGKEYRTSMRGNYLALPIQLKFSAGRVNNFRPYFIAGGYVNVDITPEKNQPVRFEDIDYGLEFGVGGNIYLPLFKLCPELKFSFGLRDLINKNTSDVRDQEIYKYRNAISSGKSRMISLIFNFE